MPRGRNAANAAERKLRKDAQRNGGTPLGYVGPGGQALRARGSERGAHLEVPPFPQRLDRILLAQGTAGAAGYLESAEVDTENWRLLTLYVAYTPDDNNSILSLIPQAWNSRRQAFVSIGVVDPTLTVISVGLSNDVASRTFFQTELRSPPLDAGALWDVALQFECSPYERMRFLARAFGAEAIGALILETSTCE